MKLRSIETTEISAGQRIFLRLDLDVPLIVQDGIWKVADDNRLKSSFKTIKYLIEKKVKIIMSGYIGRPEGKVDPTKSTRAVADYFCNYFPGTLHVDFSFGGKVEEMVRALKPSQILILENLRFAKGEQENNQELASKYSSFADIYVNDAFANCHRAETSLVALPKLIPAYAGFHLQMEVETLTQVLESPQRPLFVIIGGAKIEDKLPAVKNLSDRADRIFVGGLTGCHSEILSKLGNKVSFDCGNPDLSFNKAKQWALEILKAKTIIWNGPLGDISHGHNVGTELIAQAVAEATHAGAYSLVGGGDTEAFLRSIGLDKGISFISSGGGAMLDFLSGQNLPALEPLIEK